jgi:hypothetical protein
MNQDIIDTIELGLSELESQLSGNLYFGSYSASNVACGFGYLHERDMMDGGYNKKFDFSIMPRSSSICTWNLKPKDQVGFVGNTVSGSFLVKNVENKNDVYSLIRLQELI